MIYNALHSLLINLESIYAHFYNKSVTFALDNKTVKFGTVTIHGLIKKSSYVFKEKHYRITSEEGYC